MSRWLLDYDQTIANTQQAMLDHCNRVFNVDYQSCDIKAWKTEDFLPVDYVNYMWGKECWLSDDVQSSAKPIEGALEGIQTLLNRGEHCMIVSDRPAELFEGTRDWLDRHGLDMIRLLFTRHKHSMNLSNDNMTKLQAAYLYQLRNVVDDSPHHPIAFSERTYIDQIYLLDMPYNQGVEGPKITRVDGWSEIPL